MRINEEGLSRETLRELDNVESIRVIGSTASIAYQNAQRFNEAALKILKEHPEQREAWASDGHVFVVQSPTGVFELSVCMGKTSYAAGDCWLPVPQLETDGSEQVVFVASRVALSEGNWPDSVVLHAYHPDGKLRCRVENRYVLGQMTEDQALELPRVQADTSKFLQGEQSSSPDII